MKLYLFLFAVLFLIGTYSLFGQKPMEEDPNVMWKYSENFHSYPAIHPNGNVLIRSHYDVLEINGLTGELIRRIYVPVAGDNTDRIEISQDGTKFMVRGCLVDYESGEVLKQGLPYLLYSFFHPYNDKVIYVKNDLTIEVVDLNDDSKTEYKVSTQGLSITAFALSKDGKYFAIAREDFVDEPNTYFDLFDAKTLKPIRQLEKVKAEGGTIEFIQFSENAKYVGYGHLPTGTPKATFFNCESPYKKWEYKNSSGQTYHSLGFIYDEYAFMSGQSIWDIAKSKEIYFSNKFISNFPLFNKQFTSAIVGDISKPAIVALDLNKILNSVSVNEKSIPEVLFTTEYRKGILAISNYKSITGIVKIEIIDIQGNIMLSTVYSSITDYGRIEIPVNLTKSVYILKLQDGKQNYSQKFIVTQ